VKVTEAPAVCGDAGDDVKEEIVTGGWGAFTVYVAVWNVAESTVDPTCRTSTLTT